MNNYFQKINFVLPEYDPLLLKGATKRSYPGIEHFYIKDSSILEQLYSLCPLTDAHIIYNEVTSDLPPHRDYMGTVVINYYIDAGLAKTNFYSSRTETSLFVNGASVYDSSNCKWETSFIAKNNSCYLLNTSEIHSVKLIKPALRTFLTYAFPSHSYEEIATKLQHLWC